MIKISNESVFNFDNAIRGMRNPMNSWDLMDSFTLDNDFILGEKDKKLAQTLISLGTDHSKFMRQIFVSMDIEAPRAWWIEMDTYKVGTTSNSCSTMHTIMSKEFTKDMFSCESFKHNPGMYYDFIKVLNILNALRNQWLETKDKNIWRNLIDILPQCYNQKRTWTANYGVLRNIYKGRHNHKLKEWQDFCQEILNLPYANELIVFEGGE